MASEHSRYGLFTAALGSAMLAVSVFLPWYGVSLTAQGAASVQSFGDEVAAQFGNATLRAELTPLHASLNAIVGQQIASVSARQALTYMSVVLLVLAALALLDALFALTASSARPGGAGASLVLLGVLASVFVAYRMIAPPSPVQDIVALSLRPGAWLSLIGSLMILGGGLWPRFSAGVSGGEGRVEDALAQLSGWTPQS